MDRLNTRPRWHILLLAWIVAAAVLVNPHPGAAQATRCTAPFLIDVTLPNNARWSMCWERRANEGIVLYDVHYILPGGPSHLVLYQGSLAELHVPYDDNTARFFDVSIFGLGNNLRFLAAADCPGGALVQDGDGNNILCLTISNEGYAFKTGTVQKQASALTLFSVSKIGAYVYVPQWKFYDDGSIELSVGSTGQLQRCTSDSRYGWPLGSRCVRGTSHTHNFWWRLDLDLDGRSNDAVQQIQFNRSTSGMTFTMALSSIPTEASRAVSPSTFRSWRVRDTSITNSDGHKISYELVPESSHLFRGPNNAAVTPYEPWTANDIYMTRYRFCEQWLVNNTSNPGNDGTCADRVTQFVNGETITDPVLWYGVAFHHVARDEDEPHMSTHWTGFRLVPRDLTATNLR